MKGGVCHRLSKWVMCLRLTMEHDYFKTTIPTVTVRPDNKRPFLLWEFFHALYLVSIEVFASCTPQMAIWSWANQKCLPPNFMRRQISVRALLKAQKVRVSLGRVARRFPVSAIFQFNFLGIRRVKTFTSRLFQILKSPYRMYADTSQSWMTRWIVCPFAVLIALGVSC